MPNIDKVKKTKTKKKKGASLPKNHLPVAVKKAKTAPKKDVIAYYNCLLTQAQQNFLDSQTGTKKKITACCQECKSKAPNLSAQRDQEVKKLVVAYKQVGDSLTKLLQPLK